MNTKADRVTVNDGVDAPGAPPREVRASRVLAICFAVLLVIALGLSAWLIAATGVPDVSAAAADEQSTSQVPYFPSLYVNQATVYEPPPATF